MEKEDEGLRERGVEGLEGIESPLIPRNHNPQTARVSK